MAKKDLRIVFMGTPDFAVESLKKLVENNYNIVGVVTVPDKPAGRGQKIRQSPVKVYAESEGIKVLQPVKLKDPEFLAELEELRAELQIIVAFRMLPEVVWNMPPLGSFNLHASLLPQYRGAAPINWAVINGEKETGVTTFFLQHEIDTGNIIFSEKVEITPEDNAGTVHDKLMLVGGKLIIKTVQAIEEETVQTMPQEHLAEGAELKPAPKIFKEDCKINWEQSALTIQNKIRGLSPYPAAWFSFIDVNQKQYTAKIFNSSLKDSSELKPCEVSTDGKTYFRIGTLKGEIEILELQLAGKKRMRIGDFLRGFTHTEGLLAK
ncbi:methionyl-tRNA formyltransferase [Marinilabiliaceae bacterium JC017]|nr:methionyl-tRNA formyltransferase [Marinilabiliaceae bacterium JC017]